MKIEKNGEKAKFVDMRCGDCFMYDNDYFIKANGGNVYNAVNLQDDEDAVSRKAVINLVNAECVDLQDGSELWRSCVNDTVENIYLGVKALPPVTPTQKWIPVSERLPKKNEYIGDVCKYYLIQDEYGDMHVAHLSNVGWIPMDSLKAIGNEIIAWQELPWAYVPEINVGNIEESEDKE